MENLPTSVLDHMEELLYPVGNQQRESNDVDDVLDDLFTIADSSFRVPSSDSSNSFVPLTEFTQHIDTTSKNIVFSHPSKHSNLSFKSRSSSMSSISSLSEISSTALQELETEVNMARSFATASARAMYQEKHGRAAPGTSTYQERQRASKKVRIAVPKKGLAIRTIGGKRVSSKSARARSQPRSRRFKPGSK